MLNLGLIGFTNPWLLAALVALPALWWLLRIIPPAPREIRFPAIRFLLGLDPDAHTSARTPLWLLILRLVLAGLLILALAGPVFNPEARLLGQGPLVLVVDDGWAAAPGWDARRDALQRFASQAQRQNREVLLVGTAPDPTTPTLRRLGATDAVRLVSGWQPKPWPVDRAGALESLTAEPLDDADIVWLSDGLGIDDADRSTARRFAQSLRQLGPLQVYVEPDDERAVLMVPPESTETGLTVTIQRPRTGSVQGLAARAFGPDGEVLARTSLVFEENAAQAQATIALPAELRNRIARLELEPSAGIGGVVLLDERWRRRVVGLIGESASQASQPLLSEIYYLERAIAPHVELRRGTVEELLSSTPGGPGEGGLSAVILPDAAQITADARVDLDAWVQAGGVLLRFAGPRLANAEDDSLIPVPLRRGDRNLGGALTWSRPLPLADFDEDGPLAGLSVPEGDVVVQRQVLAQPGPDLSARTWARLADDTPLITGAPQGGGWLILVHTTANTTWSSLPLSGVFVDVLRRIVALGPGSGGTAQGVLAPVEVLDANGRLVEPGPAVQAVPADQFTATTVGPTHPAGLYGRVDAGEDAARLALNLASAIPDLGVITDFGVRTRAYRASAELDLAPWLLLAALLLALADTLIGLQLRGLLLRRAATATTAAVVVLLIAIGPTLAQTDDDTTVAMTSETRLAYVLTGLSQVDETSRAGLEGLSIVLNRRTAIEAGEPRGVNLAVDDLNLFPLLYWPVPGDHPGLSPGVAERLDAYLRQGGMILFDTGDAAVLIPGQPGPGPGERRLRQLLGGLNLPPLEPVPEDHTLTRSFYLLQDFPGRFTGRTIWVDRAEAGVNDGVSAIIIGGHDWAGAWAIDEYGLSRFPVLPGGERQREMARRFGVNLVMYALTGNYKTDQVHIPALLERLGQ